jgi:hypothetical protein
MYHFVLRKAPFWTSAMMCFISLLEYYSKSGDNYHLTSLWHGAMLLVDSNVSEKYNPPSSGTSTVILPLHRSSWHSFSFSHVWEFSGCSISVCNTHILLGTSKIVGGKLSSSLGWKWVILLPHTQHWLRCSGFHEGDFSGSPTLCCDTLRFWRQKTFLKKEYSLIL